MTDCGLDVSLKENNLTCVTCMIFNLSFFLFSYYEITKPYPDFSNGFQGYKKTSGFPLVLRKIIINKKPGLQAGFGRAQFLAGNIV